MLPTQTLESEHNLPVPMPPDVRKPSLGRSKGHRGDRALAECEEEDVQGGREEKVREWSAIAMATRRSLRERRSEAAKTD